MQPSPPIRYKDKVLFPVLIVITNIIDLYLTYYEFYFNHKYLFTLFLDTVEVTAAWLVIRWIILQLDRRYPYQGHFVKRVLLQLALTSVAGLVTVIVLTESINRLLTTQPVPIEVYTHHIWLFEIWIIVFNGIYLAMYFFQSSQHWQQALQQQSQPPDAEAPVAKDMLLVRLGNRSKVLPLSEVRYCTTGSEFSVVGSLSGEVLLTEKSLEQLEGLLPPQLFFRANRQYIIHRELVQSVERIENGKLRLLLRPFGRLPGALVISRTKAPALKEWLRQAAV